MKSRAARLFIVGLLVLLALGLGVANKIRTDRRASKVAESLNRKEPPRGPVVHEGPGAASTTEADQPVGEEPPPTKKSTSDPKAEADMDWIELRRAVRAGDATKVGNMRGKVGPQDAGIIYSLINEIPAGAREFERIEITSTLTRLLLEIKTEESSGYLLALLTQGALLDNNARGSIPWQLGLRKYIPAAPALEVTAFEDIGLKGIGERRGDRYNAMGALIQLDPGKYLSLVSQQLRSVPDTNLWCVVNALRTTAEIGTVDIGPAVADLQTKFRALPREYWEYKNQIGVALALYAHSSKSMSQSVKTWLLHEVKGLLDPAVQAGMDEASREAYRDLLKFTETGKAAK